MSLNRLPSIKVPNTSVTISLSNVFTVSLSSFRAKWYTQSISPVPNAKDAILWGCGSPVTTTICGVLPFLFRIKFNASVRVFCDRSLRIVHLQETLACKIIFWLFNRRKGVSEESLAPCLINFRFLFTFYLQLVIFR